MAERAQGTGTVQLVAELGGARVTLLERDAELAMLGADSARKERGGWPT